MNNPSFVKYKNFECLVDLFAKELSSLTPSQLGDSIVVLPNKRLEVALSSQIASIKGASFFPETYSIDEYLDLILSESEHVQDEYRKLNSCRLISSVSEELILRKLIDEGEYKFISAGHEHEVCVFVNSLFMNKQRMTWFESSIDALSADQVKSEISLDIIKERLTEVRDLIDSYDDFLEKNSLYTGTQKTSKIVEIFESLSLNENYCDNLYFFGFTTIQPIYKDALIKLSSAPNFRLRLSEAPLLYSNVNPINDLLALFPSMVSENSDVGLKDPSKTVTVVNSASVFDEVYTALKLAEKAIEDGVTPSKIGIFVTDEPTYAPMFRDLAGEFSFETNIALPMSLSGTVIGSFFTALDTFARSSQTVNDFQQLLSNELVWENLIKEHSQLFSKTLEIDSYFFKEQLSSKLNRMNLLVRVDQIEDEYLGALFTALKDMLGDFYVLQKDKNQHDKTSRKINVFNLRETVSKLFEGLPQDFLELDIKASISVGLNELFDSISLVRPEGFNSVGSFLEICLEKLSLVGVRGVGYPLKGVQITSVVESRYIPYDVVVVCGCVEGDFPKRLPNDVLVDNYFKMMIGLPSWAYVEAMEDTTFTLLWKRIPHLILSYPSHKSGMLTVRSRFIDRVLLEEKNVKEMNGVSYEPNAKADYKLENFQPSVLDIGKCTEFPFKLFRKLSPTAIESLIKCPYKFYLSKLKISGVNFVEEQKALLQGNWIHLVIEKFFTGGADVGYEPLALKENHTEHDLVERINKIAEILFDPGKIDYPNYFQLKKTSFPNFIRWYLGLIESEGFAKFSYSEYDIDSLNVKVPNTVGMDIYLRGVIDSYLGMDNHSILMDYKTSQTPSSSDVGKGISPQLLLYAFALSSSDKFGDRSIEQYVLSYWSVLNSKYDLSSFGDQVASSAHLKVSSRSRKPGVTESLENVFSLLNWRLESIRDEKRFVPDVGKACEYCDYQSVCRKDDPIWRDEIEENGRLEAKLQGVTK